MRYTRTLLCGLLGSMILGLTFASAAQDNLLKYAKWTYLHPANGVDPADGKPDFHEQFFQIKFDDQTWQKPPPESHPTIGFSYGQPVDDGGPAKDQPLDLGKPADVKHRMSAYVRVRFELPVAHGKLVFKCQRDDGLIIYLDGKEIARDNVGDGDEAYDLFAKRTISGEDEQTIHSYPLKAPLSAGEHLLAISLHNRGGGSSDLSLGAISLEEKSTADVAEDEDVADDDTENSNGRKNR